MNDVVHAVEDGMVIVGMRRGAQAAFPTVPVVADVAAPAALGALDGLDGLGQAP